MPWAGWRCREYSTRRPGRRKVKELTGEYSVPVLVTDDDEVVAGSQEIAAWARAHPAA